MMKNTRRQTTFAATSVLLVAMVLAFAAPIHARDARRGVGGSTNNQADIFIKGSHLEVAFNPAGSFGSRDVKNDGGIPIYSGTPVPGTYHPREARLGVISDWDLNGFDVGSPAYSGDHFLENYPTSESGWGISWTSQVPSDLNYRQKFYQLPLHLDGINQCLDCVNGLIDGCELDDCACPSWMPLNYRCESGRFPQWDLITTTFFQDNNKSAQYPTSRIVRYKGRAVGTDANVVATGEEVTVTKDLWFQSNDAAPYVVERVTIENTGNTTLREIGYLFHMIPTQEAVPESPSTGTAQAFDNINLIQSQGDVTNASSLAIVKATGKFFGMVTALGLLDVNAKVAHFDAQDWVDASNRPYDPQDVLGANYQTGDANNGSRAILAATRRATLAPGQSFVFYAFHAFHEQAIPLAIDAITPGCDGQVHAGYKLRFDVCNVCGGDGTRCLGCDGIPYSGLRYDACGVCNGNNETCRDCRGVVNGNAKYDPCGVCNGNNNTCYDCLGVKFGTTQIDRCGECGGTNACLDCFGIPYGTRKYDDCGVCGGKNNTCYGCDGIKFSPLRYDRCGVCGGNDECLGCDNRPFSGKVYDECGVCDGNGKQCYEPIYTYNCTDSCDNCPPVIDIKTTGVLNYTSVDLDFLIYRYEVSKLVAPLLDSLSSTLKSQLEEVRFANFTLWNGWLNEYYMFQDCIANVNVELSSLFDFDL